MTGSATSAAAAIKAFFMSSSPRLLESRSYAERADHQLPQRLYTPQLVRGKKPGLFETDLWTGGNSAVCRPFQRLSGLTPPELYLVFRSKAPRSAGIGIRS